MDIMHGPAFNKKMAYTLFHEAVDAGGRPMAAADAGEGKVFVAIITYTDSTREEAVRVADDDTIGLIPEENTHWMIMPVERAERLVHPQ